MSKSIIQENKECYISHYIYGLHKHHIFEGTANRRLSEEDGLWIWLRPEWHNMSDRAIHFNKKLDIEIKQMAQQKWQEHYDKTKEDFIARYGKSYID